jgi:hypothetical protein
VLSPISLKSQRRLAFLQFVRRKLWRINYSAAKAIKRGFTEGLSSNATSQACSEELVSLLECIGGKALRKRPNTSIP